MRCALLCRSTPSRTLLLSRSWLSATRLQDRSDEGRSAVHYAACQDNADILLLLVEHGCDVNTTTRSSRRTPLHDAVEMGGFDCASILLSRGSDVNAQTLVRGAGARAKPCCVHGHSRPVLVQALMTPLHFASRRWSTELVHLLMESGAYVEAAAHVSMRSARVMFLEDSDHPPRMQDGRTPLDLALATRSREDIYLKKMTVALLIARGALPEGDVTITEG